MKRAADPKIVVGYVRVSTEEQELGPVAQRAALERWCSSAGARLVAVHEDRLGGSTSVEDRPGLLAALDDVRTLGAGTLLVAKRDRLARDVVVAAMIDRLVQRDGARVVSADGVGVGDGPEAVLMRGLMDLFAQHERLVIRARTRAALAVKKSRGERVSGRAPYGFRFDGSRVVEDDAEQRVAALVRSLRSERWTLREIVGELEERGVPARSGRWHTKNVDRIVKAGVA